MSRVVIAVTCSDVGCEYNKGGYCKRDYVSVNQIEVRCNESGQRMHLRISHGHGE